MDEGRGSDPWLVDGDEVARSLGTDRQSVSRRPMRPSAVEELKTLIVRRAPVLRAGLV